MSGRRPRLKNLRGHALGDQMIGDKAQRVFRADLQGMWEGGREVQERREGQREGEREGRT